MVLMSRISARSWTFTLHVSAGFGVSSDFSGNPVPCPRKQTLGAELAAE